jgi:hypothetical protein
VTREYPNRRRALIGLANMILGVVNLYIFANYAPVPRMRDRAQTESRQENVSLFVQLSRLENVRALRGSAALRQRGRSGMMKLGAKFSSDRKYRWSLHRIWQPSAPLVCYVLLNPSTADESINDPTVSRCQTRASIARFGGLLVVNIFAWRSTDPAELYEIADPVGFANDNAILEAAVLADLVVCGWGKHGALHDRGREVLSLIRSAGKVPHALQINSDGSPEHPLYLSYKLQPKPIEMRTAE